MVVRRRLLLFALTLLLAAAVGAWRGSVIEGGKTLDPALEAGRQPNLTQVRAREAWRQTRGAGATIAVIDTGVDAGHPDFRGRVRATADCLGANGDPSRCSSGPGAGVDADGHGTHVAGIALAGAGDGTGVAGVAPEAGLIAIRALARTACASEPCPARGRATDVSAAIHWAVDEGADVVNLSLAADALGDDPQLLGAVTDAWLAGVVVVVAGPTLRLTTGVTDAPVIVVTALDPSGRPASYATGVGPARWGIAAPGGTVPSDERCAEGDDSGAILSAAPVPGGESEAYGCRAGTSMAAPHVAGAAALLRSQGLSARATVDRLLDTARDIGPAGYDRVFGAGALDAGAATGAEVAPGDLVAASEPVAPDPQVPRGIFVLAGAVLSVTITAGVAALRRT